MHISNDIYYFLEKNRLLQQTFLRIFRDSEDEYDFSSFFKLSINFCLFFFKGQKKILPSSKEEKPGCLPFTRLKTKPERKCWLRVSAVYLSCSWQFDILWKRMDFAMMADYLEMYYGASQMTTNALTQRSSKLNSVGTLTPWNDKLNLCDPSST